MCERCSVVSDTLRPHALYCPWNSPGQNTGVGSLSFLQGIFPTQASNPDLPHCRQIPYQLSHQGSPWLPVQFIAQSCPTLCDPTDCSLPGSSIHGIFQARVGCHFLLQRIFPTQESNWGLLHCNRILYQLSYQGSPWHITDAQ